MTGRWSPFGFLLPVVLFIGLFAVLPAVALFIDGAAGLGGAGMATALSDPLNRQALQNSLLQGGLSAMAAVGAGYPIGILLSRYNWPGRSAVSSMLIVPFLLPTLVVVSGVQELFGVGGVLSGGAPGLMYWSRGLPGIVLVNVLFNAPVVALLTAVGVESAPAGVEETLSTLGATPVQSYRWAWGPPSWTGALAGGLLTFLFSAEAFAAPLMLCGPRCYTLEARIWSLSQVLLSPGEAAVLSAAFAGLLMAPTLAYVALVARRRPDSVGASRAPRTLPWRSPAVWPLLGSAIVVLGLVAMLLGTIVIRAVLAAAPGGAPTSAWSELFGPRVAAELGLSTGQALVNSFLFAGAAAGIAVLLGLLTGSSPRRGSVALRSYLFLPLLISPVVLSFALATFWRPALGGQAQVWMLILLAQAALALPFALQGVDVALRSVPPRLRESARALGAGPFTAYLEAEVPMLRRALVTAGLFAFALGMGEFTATYFLATPAFTTLPVEMYDLQGLRHTGAANALAGLLVGVSLVAFWALHRGGSRVAL